MKFWQSISWAEADQLVEIARFAEQVGMHGVINSERLFLTHKTSSDYPLHLGRQYEPRAGLRLSGRVELLRGDGCCHHHFALFLLGLHPATAQSDRGREAGEPVR